MRGMPGHAAAGYTGISGTVPPPGSCSPRRPGGRPRSFVAEPAARALRQHIDTPRHTRRGGS